MAKYVKGSREWLEYIEEALITIGDLLAHQENLSDEEVETLCNDHNRLVWELCYYLRNSLN